MKEEFLQVWRKKLDSLSETIPGYSGSPAQKQNEFKYQALLGLYQRENSQADEAAEEPAPVINIKGGYKIK